MKTVVFDTNVYDELYECQKKLQSIQILVSEGVIRIILPQAIEQELSLSPHEKELSELKVERVSNSVLIVDVTPVDTSRVGAGVNYKKHLGNSKSKNIIDATLADLASLEADFIVTNDKRFKRRFVGLETSCKCLSLSELLELLSI